MKVKLNELLQEAHGKICSRDEAPVMAFNSKYDVQYCYHTHKTNPNLKNPTNLQTQRRNKFRNTIKMIKEAQAQPTTWEGIREDFKKQTKYKTLWNYAFSVYYPSSANTAN